MTRFIKYLANFICVFVLNVHAYGANLTTNSETQILSAIYAEYNNDFETWKSLPNYEKYKEKEVNFLSQFIINEYEGDLLNINSDSYISNLLSSLVQVNSQNCEDIFLGNEYYLFEEPLSLIVSFWSSYCQKKINLSLLNDIDNRFITLKYLNSLYYYYLENDFLNIQEIYNNLNTDNNLLSQFNYKELNLINYIFNKYDLNLSSKNITNSMNTINNLTSDLDAQYKIESFIDVINLQVLQTSIYYYYTKEFKKSLVLLSYLQKYDPKNKQHYDYKKISFMAELNPNQQTLKLIEQFQFQQIKFQYFKDYLYLKTAIESKSNINDLRIYFENITSEDLWQKNELALIIAMEYYRKNNNLDALNFIENCCYEAINSSTDPIQLFKYGILLERNNFFNKSEDIIQRSIDISKGSYPYILNYLAYLWVENNQNLDTAENMLLKAVEDSNFQDGAILDSLGWLYFKKNEIDIAKKWISQAYKMEPSEPEIIDHLSQIYFKLGRFKESQFLDNKIILFHKDYFKYAEVLARN